jgi:acetone carboxylase gamma subunit
MSTRQSRTLIVLNGFICCAECKKSIAPAGTSWKCAAALTRTRVIDIPGSTSSTHPDVEIRHFSCPACGALLDSETALPEDPFLDDILTNK